MNDLEKYVKILRDSNIPKLERELIVGLLIQQTNELKRHDAKKKN